MLTENKKIVARCIATGLYFNGVNFNESKAANALALRPGTTADSFGLSWAGPVAIDTFDPLAQQAQAMARNPQDAAAHYVTRSKVRDGNKPFYIFCADGKFHSRKVTVDAKKHGGNAWINWKGDKVAVVLVGEILMTEAGAFIQA